MNRKKLEIIKKVLGTHEWELREDRNIPRFAHHLFIFSGYRNFIMGYDEMKKELFYPVATNLKIQRIFGFNNQEVTKLMKDLVGELFGWEVETTPSLPQDQAERIKDHFQTK